MTINISPESNSFLVYEFKSPSIINLFPYNTPKQYENEVKNATPANEIEI